LYRNEVLEGVGPVVFAHHDICLIDSHAPVFEDLKCLFEVADDVLVVCIGDVEFLLRHLHLVVHIVDLAEQLVDIVVFRVGLVLLSCELGL